MGTEFRCPIDGLVCTRNACVESHDKKDLLPCDTAAAGIAFRVVGAAALQDATGQVVNEEGFAREASQAASVLEKSPRDFTKRVEFFIRNQDQNPLR